MTGTDMRQASSRKWACIASGSMAGWLVFLFSLFLTVIAFSSLLSGFGVTVLKGDGLFFAEVIAAGALSLLAAVYVGMKFSKWLRNRGIVAVYMCLGVLFVLSVLSFPQTFSFVAEESTQQVIIE